MIVNHLKFLLYGGLNPDTADSVRLRERRNVSTSVFILAPLCAGMLVLNIYSGASNDNPAIALGMCVIVSALYLQAYLNRPTLAANIIIFSFWGILISIIYSDGLINTPLFWMVAVAPTAILLAGYKWGVRWFLICLCTIWAYAMMQYTGALIAKSALSQLVIAEMGHAQILFYATEASLLMTILTVVTLVFRNSQLRTERSLRQAVDALKREIHTRSNAEEDAHQSEQAKSAFLAAMSHELRTPLNGVLGASRLLLEAPNNEDRETYTKVIVQSGELLLELINNVMDLSSFESGNLHLESEPTDLRLLVNELIPPLRFQAQKKNLKLISHVGESVPDHVMFDAIRIKQILINLLGNAIKFTETGKINLAIDLHAEQIYFKVTDTGIGVSSEDQATLFEPYVKTKASMVEGYVGSGLGLAIVKKLVTAMEGNINLQSAPSKGSTFTITLPHQSVQQGSIRQTLSNLPNPSCLNVLIVDDNAINRLVLSRLLEKDQHQVVSVEDGQDAVDYVRNHDVDVVMMDIQMPRLDGISATKLIRELPGDKKDIPVIAITANTIIEKSNRDDPSGFNGYLGKPFIYENLVAELKRVATR